MMSHSNWIYYTFFEKTINNTQDLIDKYINKFDIDLSGLASRNEADLIKVTRLINLADTFCNYMQLQEEEYLSKLLIIKTITVNTEYSKEFYKELIDIIQEESFTIHRDILNDRTNIVIDTINI